jgi:hypothetical protein
MQPFSKEEGGGRENAETVGTLQLGGLARIHLINTYTRIIHKSISQSQNKISE